MTDHTLRLSDGRRLAYAEYGDPEGEPVVLLHGNPGSRLFYGQIPGVPFRDGLRLICPDRPGYGQSDFFPRGRGVADWPDDLVELADALGIERFALFGPSGGGPYALASAWKIPERLSAVGIFASTGPFAPEVGEGMNPSLRLMFRIAGKRPWSWVLRGQTALMALLARRALGLYLKVIALELSEEDRATHARLGLREALRTDRAEAFRQGGRASYYDVTIPGRWPIALEEISMPIHLWQGEDDRAVGGMGSYLAEHLPHCQATFIPGAGHFWLFEHMAEVLDALVPGGAPAASAPAEPPPIQATGTRPSG